MIAVRVLLNPETGETFCHPVYADSVRYSLFSAMQGQKGDFLSKKRALSIEKLNAYPEKEIALSVLQREE